VKIVVAMSGGVDSSVAAARLVAEGHECVGLFMRNGAVATEPETSGRPRGCCSVSDAADARRVAARLDVPFYALDFAEDFERHVIGDFVASYRDGRTPNPCILCNRDLKFGRLLDYADAIGAEKVATGHYARIVPRADGRAALARAVDRDKDQSYVLYPLETSVLERVVFPLGELRKEEVRAQARELGLVVADKPESQEICFVPGGDYREVLRERDPGGARPGEIVDLDGRVLGRHDGIRGFTIGQRRGLGLALGKPRYVVRLEPETDRVVLGSADDLLAASCVVGEAVWTGVPTPPAGEKMTGSVCIRAHHEPAPARIEAMDGGRFRVEFERPQAAITPGQAAVAYAADGTVIVGGRIRGM
jgi:tRNA-specific 2-thiouridylase